MSAFTEAVEKRLKGLKGVSTGACPGCADCASMLGYAVLEDYDLVLERDGISSTRFSWRPCGICGTQLGGDRDVWHYVDSNNEIVHENAVCTDCVLYHANGDEPEQWRRS